MHDRQHELADRAEQRQRQRGPEEARQERMRRDGADVTQAEQRQLAAGQTTAYRRGR